MDLMNHDLMPGYVLSEHVLYEEHPVYTSNGGEINGLHAIWITLNNPTQHNSYNTQMVKDVIVAFQRAGTDRRCVAVVFTGTGDKAFCTGGNTKEYAEYYAGRPMEYAQYMWLFNMMVNSILLCQHPVICRVNGMRVAGGQEIGMACDFTIAGDHSTFGQAGPKHGSAPIGGSTDFLSLFLGVERAMQSGVLCKIMNAREAMRCGLISDCVKVYRKGNDFIDNPLLNTVSTEDEAEARIFIKTECEIDLSLLDNRIDKMITELLELMPGCVMKTIDEIRGKKWREWARNFPGHRHWLALNMMTDARAGFTAFNSGDRKIGRTINFAKLRLLIAEGKVYDDNMINRILPEGVKLPG